MKINRFTRPLWDVDTPYYFNDFGNFATGTDGVTSLAADAGASVAAGATRNGVVVLTTGGTDNNEAAVYETNAHYLLLDAKPIYARLLAQYAEANTDDANVFIGLASAPGANLMVDDGAGPRASGTLLGIYKVDGGTVWWAVTRNGSAVTTTQSTTTAGGSAYSLFEVIASDWDGVEMEVSFKVDGQYLKDANGVNIRHRVAISGATIASSVAYVKAGGANSEVLNVDSLYAHQAR
jgi:hypothetical protein